MEPLEMTTQTVKFSAAWSPDDSEVTIVRDVHAGISGPYGRFKADSLEAAAGGLLKAGYVVTSGWELAQSGSHWATLAQLR